MGGLALGASIRVEATTSGGLLNEGFAKRIDSADCDAVLIAGPTASGKSALAVEVARATGGEIINADSMQVYSGLSLLSARPRVEDMGGISHHLYGFVPPDRAYSTGDYLRDVQPVLRDLAARGKRAVIVGGTGLYFKALSEGLVATPEIPYSIRAALEAEAAAGADMHARLGKVDPLAAARLSRSDTPRLLRALEVIEATGQTLAAWQANETGAPILTPGRWQGVFLHPDREALGRRIDARLVAMIEAGALDEVRGLAALGLPANRGVMKAHGMPHLLAHLAGVLSLQEATRLGQQDTRRYAKRQVTWARKFMGDWQWRAVG